MITSREKKERRKIEQQENIFRTVMALLKKYDYGDITVRHICTEAGISIGMFYRNFGSKDDVLTYFYTIIAEAYERDVRNKITTMPFQERLVSYYSWVAEFTGSFGLEFTIHFLRINKPGVKSDFHDNEVVEIGCRILRDAAARGETEANSESAMFDITHDILIINKGVLLDWCITGGIYDLTEYTRKMLNKTLPGILHTALSNGD